MFLGHFTTRFPTGSLSPRFRVLAGCLFDNEYQVNLGVGRPHLQVVATLFDKGDTSPSTPDFYSGSLRGAEIQESRARTLVDSSQILFGAADVRHSNLRSSQRSLSAAAHPKNLNSGTYIIPTGRS